MKLLLLLPILLIFNSTNAQTWQILDIPASVSRYDDVFFLYENLGWAADGVGSKVYKTTDGGQTWALQFEKEHEYFRNVEFLDENIGFVGTLTPNFYRTVDGGNTWENLNIPGVQAICGIDAVGEATIYACGAYFQPAYIIKSTDSGQNWTFIDMSDFANSLVEIMFLDENLGFASGGNDQGGMILKTTDGGISWTEIYNSNLPGEYVWKMQQLFSNPDVLFGAVQGYGSFNGRLLKSTDFGQNWLEREVPDPVIQAVGFVTENHGWMGGHNTGFLETFDGGETWTNTEFGFLLNRIFVINEDLAYCAGSNVYKYSDDLIVTDQNFSKPKDLEILIGPNPTSDFVNVSIDFPMPNHLLVTIFDESGKKIEQVLRETISSKGKRNYQFKMPEKPGIYFLEFHYDLGAQSKKIIKK